MNRRYYWDMYAAPWPSRRFVRNVRRECDRFLSPSNPANGMRNVLLAVTTRCPLQCEHCYEWDNLNQKEQLAVADLEQIIERLLQAGVGQIHLSGGEPLVRYEEIRLLIEKYSPRAGFWIVTSGFHFTPERARALKMAGLTGVCVSIDDHRPDRHAAFRHYEKAYEMATQAVVAARKEGLLTAVSLCATNAFITEQNLVDYANLARSLGASFIQLLEPRAVGHYAGKEVGLDLSKRRMLLEFFTKMNTEKDYDDYPGVIYHDHFRRSAGCRGGGRGAFYIDPFANVHACPFCRKSAGNLLEDPLTACVGKLLAEGCGAPAPQPEPVETTVATPVREPA